MGNALGSREDWMRRHWAIVNALNNRPCTLSELARLTDRSTKTIRRDVHAMLSLGVVSRDGNTIILGEKIMSAVKCSVCDRDFRSQRALNGHAHIHRNGSPNGRDRDFRSQRALNGHAHIHRNGSPNGRAVQPLNQERFSAELFSVMTGDIHLRGCEFKGGFLVINGDRLTLYPHLRDAIEEAAIDASVRQREAEISA